MKLSTSSCIVVVTFAGTVFLAQPAVAQCPLAHTHIGINPTSRPNWSDPGDPAGDLDCCSTDDSQLWMFSIPPVDPVAPTPAWPQWGDSDDDPFLRLIQELDEYGEAIAKPDDSTKFLYTCRFMWGDDGGYGDPEGKQHLDGWHSANGPRGMWSLDSTDEFTIPDWEIWLRRIDASVPEDDFFMMLPNDDVVLDTNGGTYKLEKVWLEDQNAWGIHEHMGYYFWLADDMVGQTVWCDFTAFDTGGMYTEGGSSLVGQDGVPGEHAELCGSDAPFRFRSKVTPEPGSLCLLFVGLLAVVRRRT
ncbi:MAG: PEP-CTERM sorting domain-containing protein [Phycisphaerae bacterium]|nr:PEP-CTERM sorting domain-containing protein [Phycisphaerae bacterium]